MNGYRSTREGLWSALRMVKSVYYWYGQKSKIGYMYRLNIW
jgi:hypothetical protein